MKKRSVLLMFIFFMAITTSFASKTLYDDYDATYFDSYSNCLVAHLVQIPYMCSTINTGAQCTVYVTATTTAPAYVYFRSLGYGCTQPLHMPY